MPPRWPRKPTRKDPEFRKLDDRYTFAAHIAVYLTSATGLTFFNMLWQANWSWLLPLLGWWGLGLGVHAIWILVIASYPGVPTLTDLEPAPLDQPPSQPTPQETEV